MFFSGFVFGCVVKMGWAVKRMAGNPVVRDLVLVFLGLLLGIILHSLASTLFFSPTIIPVFSPYAQNTIIGLIDNAEKTIDIEMYVLTSADVVEALKRAHDRGVKVRVILERNVIGGENSGSFGALKDYGVDVRWASDVFKLTHSKFMIVDGKHVLVGSHNFSNSALTLNREASVIVEKSPAAVEAFRQVFEDDWALAQEF